MAPSGSSKDASGRVQPLRGALADGGARALWAAFRDADTREAFHTSWLEIQCALIGGVVRGIVLARTAADEAFAPVGVWPVGQAPGGHLAKAAEKALSERRALALQLEPQAGREAPSRTCIAQPVEAHGETCAVVVIELSPRPQPELELALRQLCWGSAWLELAARRETEGPANAGAPSAAGEVLEIVAAPLEHERFHAAATALVTDLARRFGCDRVAFGSAVRGRVALQAISHSALFSERASVARSIEAAMEEALDQERAIVHPAPAETAGDSCIRRCHARLCESGRDGAGTGTACSIPVAHAARFCAVVTLERAGERPFEAGELERIESAVSLAAPMLEVLRREDRWLGAKVGEALRELGERFVGPRHTGLKLGAALALGAIAAASLLRADYRVTADAALEARVLRAAVAPFDGFVSSAPARAGDRVAEGDLLATLDDRELRLERARWSSQLEQLGKQYRQAMAERDAAHARIQSAQMEQARAQLALVDEQLDKMVLRAPFDGVVVTGDLSQRLGAPVQRGQLLYEVAPENAFRVVLEVDERDIDEIAIGQSGSLVFSAFPDEAVSFRVEQITPVSSAEEGRNAFRVEGAFLETPAHLQPGMQGVGKVSVDRRRLIWIFSHEVTDWLRLALWKWLP